MKSNYIADTTVLVDYLRNIEYARGFLERERPAISSVSRAELIHGAKDKPRLREAMALCDSLEESFFTEVSTKDALQLLETYHLSHGLFFLDALIAATAIEHGLTLVTHNIKHFSFIPKLSVRAWKDAVAEMTSEGS